VFAPSLAGCTSEAYFASTPVVTLAGGAVQSRRRASISGSGTSMSIRRLSTSMVTWSPVRSSQRRTCEAEM